MDTLRGSVVYIFYAYHNVEYYLHPLYSFFNNYRTAGIVGSTSSARENGHGATIIRRADASDEDISFSEFAETMAQVRDKVEEVKQKRKTDALGRSSDLDMWTAGTSRRLDAFKCQPCNDNCGFGKDCMFKVS